MEVKVMISYKPFEHLLIDRGMIKKDVQRICNIQPATMARFGKGESVSLSIIERICLGLNCKIEEVVEILPDE